MQMTRFLLLTMLLLTLQAPLYGSKTIGDLEFEDEFGNLITKAAKSHRVMVVEFFADW